MYKVFINDRVICFTNNAESCDQFSHGLVLNFYSPIITPFIVELLSDNKKMEMIIIAVDEYESAFNDFLSYFEIIKAAGGIVFNSQGERLFIYRLDKWDLPKGKIENGEEIEDAAMREVEEECGVDDLSIANPLKDTFHIYKLKDNLILKQTHWFEMNTTYEGKLVPQQEECITKVEWLRDSEVADKVLKNTYASIKELLSTTSY